MAMTVRRIVTGHDEKGRAVVASDEQITGRTRSIRREQLRDLVDGLDAGRSFGRSRSRPTCRASSTSTTTSTPARVR